MRPPKASSRPSLTALVENAKTCFACAAIHDHMQPGMSTLFGALACVVASRGALQVPQILCDSHKKMWVELIVCYARETTGDEIEKLRKAAELEIEKLRKAAEQA